MHALCAHVFWWSVFLVECSSCSESVLFLRWPKPWFVFVVVVWEHPYNPRSPRRHGAVYVPRKRSGLIESSRTEIIENTHESRAYLQIQTQHGHTTALKLAQLVLYAKQRTPSILSIWRQHRNSSTWSKRPARKTPQIDSTPTRSSHMHEARSLEVDI